MFDKSITARRIRTARESMEWSQEKLCAQVYDSSHEVVSVQSMSSYERGKTDVPLSVLVALADVFHVTTDYLLGVSDDPNPYAAEVTKYTGLSPRAAKMLHTMLAADGGDRVTLSVLNDLVLYPGFHSTLSSMYLLRRSAEEIEKIELQTPETLDEEIMESKRDFGLYKAANDRYGVAVILKNMDAVYYEADRIVLKFRSMVSSICGIRKAARIWNKKCADEHAEYNKKWGEAGVNNAEESE